MPKRRTVSIEAGAERIRAAELADGRKGADVSRVVEFDTPEDCIENGYITDAAKLGEILENNLAGAGINTVNAVFTIISDDILVGGAQIPRDRKQDLDQAVREKAQEIFGLAGPGKDGTESDEDPENREAAENSDTGKQENAEDVSGGSAETETQAGIDDYYTSYKIQDDTDKSGDFNLIIYAAPSELIDSYYDLAEYAGLHLEATDYSGNSIFQWMHRGFGQEAVMLVDLRRSGSTATIMTDGVLRVQADLMSRTEGLVDAIREMEENAGMEDFIDGDVSGYNYGDDRIASEGADAIAEISRIARDFLSENAEDYIDRIVISSEGEGVIALAGRIQKETGITTLTLEDLPNGIMVRDEAPFEELEPGSYIGVIGAVISPLEFRPPAAGLPARAAEERRGRLTKVMTVIIIICLIATAALCVTFFIMRTHHNSLNSRLEKVKYMEDIYDQYKDAENKNSEIKALDDSTDQKNELLSQLFSDLESDMPSDSEITSMNSSDDLVTFSVSAGSKETAAQFIMQLRKLDYLSDISVSELTDTTDSSGDSSVEFTVSATLTGDPSEDVDASNGANDDDIDSGNSDASGAADTSGDTGESAGTSGTAAGDTQQ